MSVAGIAVATEQYVNTTLTSDTTANSTKLLIESGAGTGFDGSSTSLTMTKINPLVIHSTQHIPDGSGGWTAHPASTANTFTCNCLGSFANGVSVSSGNVALGATGEITRGTVNVIQKLTKLHRDYRHTVTLTNPAADSVHDLFSTDGSFQVFEYGATTSTNATLPTEACYSMTLNFGNGWTFGSTATYNSLRCAAFGITSEQDNSTNDTIDPNTSVVPSSWNYHRSELVTPYTVMDRYQFRGHLPRRLSEHDAHAYSQHICYYNPEACYGLVMKRSAPVMRF